ncbi:MAG: FadR family transcriptional regulator [Thermomicrobiales bacterium]|nr:FadR family transcriptional regulator [Thermomicrobiales bacterium]
MSMTNASPSGNVGRKGSAHSHTDLPRMSSSYQAVTVTRSYERVVRQIAESIRDGGLSSGERLPTERELSAAFGVSRGVIREAIKVLGALGMVEARQGSGIYVLNTTPTITRAFTLSVSPDMESVERLFEFRRALESDAASFAALRRTPAQLAEIEQTDEAMADIVAAGQLERFGEIDDRFHLAIARASGNPYYEVAVATARDLQHDVVPLVAHQAGSFRAAVGHHRAILVAIANQDGDAAAGAMSDHIVYTAKAVTQRTGDPDLDKTDLCGEGPA